MFKASFAIELMLRQRKTFTSCTYCEVFYSPIERYILTQFNYSLNKFRKLVFAISNLTSNIDRTGSKKIDK